MNNIPLIHTTKGNIPLDTLQHSVEWKLSPEQIIFIESYFLGDELVKQSSHVRDLSGVESAGVAAI